MAPDLHQRNKASDVFFPDASKRGLVEQPTSSATPKWCISTRTKRESSPVIIKDAVAASRPFSAKITSVITYEISTRKTSLAAAREEMPSGGTAALSMPLKVGGGAAINV